MSRYFEGLGIKISNATISKRCREIYQSKGMDVPKANRGWKPLSAVVIDSRAIQMAFENLRESRKATDLQLKRLAKEYNIQWDFALYVEDER